MLLQLDGAQGEIHAKYMQLRCLKRKEVKKKRKKKRRRKRDIRKQQVSFHSQL